MQYFASRVYQIHRRYHLHPIERLGIGRDREESLDADPIVSRPGPL